MNDTMTKRGAPRDSRRDEEFGAYVDARRGDLVRAATLLVAGDRWEAEDLVQTALARLYVAWPRVRADTVDAYARRCLVNALIDHRRLASTRRERAHAEPPERADDASASDELRAVVFTALAALPPRMRAAVVMRHLLDLSVKETAAALRCRQGTVKSQTARGLEQLHSALSTQGISVQDVDSDAPPATADRRTGLRLRRAGDLTINS